MWLVGEFVVYVEVGEQRSRCLYYYEGGKEPGRFRGRRTWTNGNRSVCALGPEHFQVLKWPQSHSAQSLQYIRILAFRASRSKDTLFRSSDERSRPRKHATIAHAALLQLCECLRQSVCSHIEDFRPRLDAHAFCKLQHLKVILA